MCKEQRPHCDYGCSNDILQASNEDMPLAAVMSLTDNSKLVVWKKAIRYKFPIESKRTVLNYNRNDLIIFRGDLVHAGAAYEEENLRLHVYLDSGVVPRVPGKTFKVDL
jgi:hypothetical protein